MKAIVVLVVTIPILIWGLFCFLGRTEESVQLTISPGMSNLEIARLLEDEGVIKNRYCFLFISLIQGRWGGLQAGEYRFSEGERMGDVLEKISSGDTVWVRVTVPECSTKREIEEILGSALDREVSLSEENDGFFFPDTYYLSPDITDEEIEPRMMREDQEREVIIMASILEGELKEKEDMELVSDLLWRRIKVGMPLQVDVSPYTYDHRGLPPEPVCNPGLDGIEAALNPKENDYWYYLTSKTGETIFSRSFEEHKKSLKEI